MTLNLDSLVFIFIIILDISFLFLFHHQPLLLRATERRHKKFIQNAKEQQTTIFHSRALFLVCLFSAQIFYG